jgi:hypothetical protein
LLLKKALALVLVNGSPQVVMGRRPVGEFYRFTPTVAATTDHYQWALTVAATVATSHLRGSEETMTRACRA